MVNMTPMRYADAHPDLLPPPPTPVARDTTVPYERGSPPEARDTRAPSCHPGRPNTKLSAPSPRSAAQGRPVTSAGYDEVLLPCGLLA